MRHTSRRSTGSLRGLEHQIVSWPGSRRSSWSSARRRTFSTTRRAEASLFSTNWVRTEPCLPNCPLSLINETKIHTTRVFQSFLLGGHAACFTVFPSSAFSLYLKCLASYLLRVQSGPDTVQLFFHTTNFSLTPRRAGHIHLRWHGYRTCCCPLSGQECKVLGNVCDSLPLARRRVGSAQRGEPDFRDVTVTPITINSTRFYIYRMRSRSICHISALLFGRFPLACFKYSGSALVNSLQKCTYEGASTVNIRGFVWVGSKREPVSHHF